MLPRITLDRIVLSVVEMAKHLQKVREASATKQTSLRAASSRLREYSLFTVVFRVVQVNRRHGPRRSQGKVQARSGKKVSVFWYAPCIE